MLLRTAKYLLGGLTARRSRKGRRPCKVPVARLGVEQLEEKVLLDAYVWWGGSGIDFNASNKNNWLVNGVLPQQAPGAGDDLIFDGTAQANRHHAVVDAAFGGVVNSLTLTAAAGSDIVDLRRDLRVLTTTSIAAGWVDGPANLFVGGVSPPEGGPPAPGTFNFTGGTLADLSLPAFPTATVQFTPGSTVNVSGNASKWLIARSLVLSSGTNMTWTGGGDLVLVAGAAIDVLNGATFQTDLTANATIDGTLNGGFDSVIVEPGGNFILSPSTSPLELEVKGHFTNRGTVSVPLGLLTFLNGSINSGTVTIGLFGRVRYQGTDQHQFVSDWTIPGQSSVVTGVGWADFGTGSKIVTNGPVVFNNVTDRSDEVQSDGNVFVNGQYFWHGNKWSGAGTTYIGNATDASPRLTLAGSSAANGYALERKVENYGIFTWTDSDINVANGGAITNKNGAWFDIRADKKIKKGAGAGDFTNGGTVQKTAGTGTAEIELKYVPQGGVGKLLKSFQGKLRIDDKVVMNDPGDVIEVAAGAGIIFAGGFEEDAGSVSVADGATFEVTGALEQNGGAFNLAGGQVSATGGYALAVDAVFSGYGSLVADVTNAGRIDVGGAGANGSLAILADAENGISGNYTQTASGKLYLEIAGPSDLDTLSVAGLASLDGLLHVDLLDGFTPAAGDVFAVLTYGSRSGSFASTELPTLPAGTVFRPRYDDPSHPDALTLWALSTLLDQSDYDPSGNGITSQVFEDDLADFTSYLFVGFTVPAEGEHVTEVSTWVAASSGFTDFTQARVLIVPKAAEGGPDVSAAAFDATVGATVTDLGNGAFQVTCAGLAVDLAAGDYYLAIAPRQDFSSAGQTFILTTVTSHGGDSWWWNPGGGFGLGTNPVPASTVQGYTADYAYQIVGH